MNIKKIICPDVFFFMLCLPFIIIRIETMQYHWESRERTMFAFHIKVWKYEFTFHLGKREDV